MSIQFGDYLFDEPIPFGKWQPPKQPCIYAVLVHDPKVKPKPYTVVFFGESENLSDQSYFRSHIKYQCWVKQAGSEKNLYITHYRTPDAEPLTRKKILNALLNKYQPLCNEVA
jgi:hypothetical protein